MTVWAARLLPPGSDSFAAGRQDASASDVAVAQGVLRTEAAALNLLADQLAEQPQGFAAATTALAGIGGRVAVSGIGKSGHVARKIAATLASTGTPAFFVHPAEASHGDLGMVMPGDAVLVLSNSGETTELADLVAHAKRFDLRLIAVTSRSGSTLARAADIVLLLPAAPEACPMGLAPTTSTTLQMALGDALAVALLTRRGFDAADFQLFHPGGRLGAQLQRVEQLMHRGEALPLASPELPMQAALLIMTEKHFGCLGVIDGRGRLVGVLTDGDLRRAMGPDLLDRTVGEVMNPTPRTIGPEMLAAVALREMNDRARPITSLFVVGPAQDVLGLLHVHDLLRAGIA